MAQMAGMKLPDFIQHMEFGTVELSSGTHVDIQLSNVVYPKGIVIYSNDFYCYDAKADKTTLGAYAVYWICPKDIDQCSSTNGWDILVSNSFYFTNWGQNTSQQNAAARYSRTESRGIYLFHPVNKQVRLRGFGTEDYDFKYNTPYHWLIWD